MNDSRSVAYARSRLRIIGVFAAFLAWATGAVELFGTPLLWVFDYPDTVAAYLQGHGINMPLLRKTATNPRGSPWVWYWRWR